MAEIMKVADVSRQTVFTYREKVVAGGVAELLRREHGGGKKPAVRGAVATEFLARLTEGKFRRAKDAQAWIKKRTRQRLSESGVRKVLRRLVGKLTRLPLLAPDFDFFGGAGRAKSLACWNRVSRKGV